MAHESLWVILAVGVIAGWLAGQILQGTGYGLLHDLIIGVLGAFVGDWVAPRIGVHLGYGILPAIVEATVGAIVLLLVLRLVRGGGGWSGGRRRWSAPWRSY